MRTVGHATNMGSGLGRMLRSLVSIALSLAIACAAYIVVATVIFGNPWKPLLFLAVTTVTTDWHLWVSAFVVCLVIGAVATQRILRLPSLQPVLLVLIRPALQVVGTILIATTIVGTVATTIRRVAIVTLAPDQVHTATFLYSLRTAGNGHTVFPHGTATKDCVPYIWSWRIMTFEQIPEGRVAAILPYEWVAGWQADCKTDVSAPGSAG